MAMKLYERLAQSINLQMRTLDRNLYDTLSEGTERPIKTGARLAKPLIVAMKGRSTTPFLNQIDYPKEYKERLFDVLVIGEFIKEDNYDAVKIEAAFRYQNLEGHTRAGDLTDDTPIIIKKKHPLIKKIKKGVKLEDIDHRLDCTNKLLEEIVKELKTLNSYADS